MPLDGYEEMPLKQFGGLNTLLDPTNLPANASPDTFDVEFFPGEVRTRPGFQTILPAFNPAAFISYVKTYVTGNINDQIRMLTLDSLGNLCKEDVSLAPGSQILISNQILFNALANSVSLFNREYIAFGDGQYGYDIPRQYDDTNLDRISLSGPGQAPAVVDQTAVFTVAAAPNGAAMQGTTPILSISEALNVVTVTVGVGLLNFHAIGTAIKIAGVPVGGYNGNFTISAVINTATFQYLNTITGLAGSSGGTADFGQANFHLTTPHTMVTGQMVTVAGVAVAGYNGTWKITTTNQGTGDFTADIGQFGLATSGTGTATPIGNIGAGVHQLSVIFQTRSGYQTKPAPPVSWTAIGGKAALISGIPIGPSNVVARIIIATPISSDNFFYVPNSFMVINDNTTTSTLIDFSDVALLNGTNVDSLFNLIVLPRCSGIAAYSSRLVAWGCVNNIKNLLNTDFDGGFVGNSPTGWTVDATNGVGVSRGTGVSGDAYLFTADGNAADQGMIYQSAFQDYLGNPILTGGTAYTLYARIKGTGALTGTVHIRLVSVTGGYDQGIAVSPNFNFPAYTANCLVLPPTVFNDLILKVYVTGATVGDTVLIDGIEAYPTTQPVELDVVRFSFPEDPESFDGITGFIQPTQANGQAVRNCFVLRDFFYIDKERSRFVTADDGQNEPNQWSVNEVSGQVGSTSIRGTGIGDEWAVTADKSGLWFFSGAQITPDSNFAKEIQPTWDNINWAFGYLVDVKVDTTRKRIYVDAPLGNSVINNVKLTLDYVEGFGDPIPSVTTSIAGIGRKWCPWAISSTAQAMVLRQTGHIFFCIGVQGKVTEQVEGLTSDDGQAINGYWQSGYFQDKQRLNFGYVWANIVGNGTANLILRKNSQNWTKQIRGWLLSTLGFHNFERQIQIQGERMAIRIGTNAPGSWFSCQGIVLYVSEAVHALVRGINS